MPEPDINLGIARDALNEIDLADLEEAFIPTLAARLHMAEQVAARAKDFVDALRMVISDRMESDDIHVDGLGWLERRPKRPSTAGSDWEGARREGRREIVQRVSLDRSTGEIRPDWVNVAHETIDLMQRTFSIGNPLQGFEKVLGLDLDEYIKHTHGGFTVAIVPEADRDRS